LQLVPAGLVPRNDPLPPNRRRFVGFAQTPLAHLFRDADRRIGRRSRLTGAFRARLRERPTPQFFGTEYLKYIVKEGLVSYTVYEFGSVLQFIETRYRIKALMKRDAEANSLLDMFDFSQKPAPPLILPLRNCA
jgi:hypothetical protein